MAHSDADTPPPSTRRGPRLKKPPSATNLHAAAAAAPPSRRDVPSHSHSHLLIPQHDPVPEMRLEKGKRKRMKKTRDDEDWMPAPPPPAPSTAAAYHRPGSAPAHSNTNAPGGLNATMMMEDVAMMHGGSGSGSGRHDTSPRQHQQMFTPALPTHVYDPTAASGSVFEEHPPVPIQSFAESERTKRQKNGVNGGGRSSSGSGASGGGGGNGQGPTSVLDLFFTDAKSKLPYPTQLITPTNERSLKRKRRQDRDGRRSRQRGGDTASDEAAFEYDMLRFGVDSVKLVPQGLVDRVDGKMSRDFIARVIVGHVDSWTRRSGFGNNFLQEITTLLTAYYPCSYPTILDEVLVAFIFRRPEFTETLLRPMVDKMLKTGDSATSARYPVIEAFARKCALETAGGSERQRHHFACLTVLRYLVERNIDKFVLSPWIVLCALECSDAVLTDLWCALLDACVGSPVARTPQCGGPDLQWHVFDPMQHVYELIREEKSCLKAGVNARLSAALLRRVLLASDHQTLVDADFVRVALEQFVTNCDRRTSSQLFQEWRVQAGQGKSKEVAAKWVAFLRPFAHVLGKLPAHRSRWLVSHVLHYLLTAVAEPEELVHALIRDYGTLMFKEGSEAPDDTAEVNGNKEHTDAVVSARIGADVVAENTVYLLEEIHEQDKAVVVVDGWRSVWIEDATKGHLSWNCVQAMVLVIATKDVDALCGSALAGKFGALVQDVCSARFSRREELESGRASGIREAVRVLLPSTRPLAGKLLFEVLSAVCACPSKSAPTGGASDMTLGNALLYCLTESSRGALSANEKAIVQKPVVEYNTTHRLTSGTDMQVLRALGELVS
ncbi:TPA: hypothetical protein N0F65_004551 [Lagenidium giganteum]|uniref:Uncharacterized protein n=1 Tax=Lagenidium giganteum TaxID=4803 RepID=A0AAV2ZC50_9STRA|nr:TPA: hypothetical protein N0F65_004551 [Lagenidium giganteum]